jgi:putative exosortase-associated protein (TIGR04073 family)
MRIKEAKMKTFAIRWLLGAVFVAGLWVPRPGNLQADEYTYEVNVAEASTTKGPFYEHSEHELRTRKFCRGVANIFLSPAEIPNQAFREAYRTSPVTGTVVGAAKGLWKGAKRVVVGAWEVATFYHPTRNNYQPYIYPEVVFMEDLH